MKRGWALLKIPHGEDTQACIEDALEEWWTLRSIGEDMTNVAFRENIVIYCLPSDSKDGYQDPRLINPYEDLLFLFYRIRRNRIEVVGTIEGRALMNTDGYFTEADMLRSRRIKRADTPTNSLLPPPEDDPPFYFPIVQNTMHISSVGMLQRGIHHRLTWLLECMEKKDHTVPFNAMGEEKEDIASLLGMDLVLQCLEFMPNSYKARLSFEKIRMAAEKHRFLSRFARFRTERAVGRLLMYNDNLLEHLDMIPQDKWDPIDFQCFYKRFGDYEMPPTAFFKVPFEEVPIEIAQHLPLHPGHVFHLTYLDVAPWIWNVYEISQQRRDATMPYPPGVAKDWVETQARRILYFKPKEEEEERVRGPTRGLQEPVDPQVGFSVAVQVLIDAMPPCMKNVVTSHFPRNQERMTLIPSLKDAGVSLETAENLFENLNNRYPSAGGAVELHSRFNVASLWNRQRGANFCKSIMTKTIQNAPEQLHCPYAKASKDNQTRPNCAECKRDAGIPDMEDMYAPHLYLKYQLTRGRKEEKEPKVKKPKIDDDEEEEEEDSFSSSCF